MPGRCTALEDLDDDHATAAAWTNRLAGIDGGTGDLGLCRRYVEQLARPRDIAGARAAGEQAIVADAVKAVRQDVDQEAADELGGGQCHDLVAITTFGTIVLPSEGDAVAVAGDQPAVGDGDAVGIARQMALIKQSQRLPSELYRSLTWDRGKELADHQRLTLATEVEVYFCDPRSPWQRGSNENTNRLLRQYLPRGTDLSLHSQAKLNAIARQLNERPRKTLLYQTPADKFADCVAATS